MERYEKLKLLRGLYCLTQEEMAELANKCQRSVYSAAEVKTEDTEEKRSSKRRLTDEQAAALCNSLKFEDGWFNGDFRPPLQGYRFVSIDMDWSQRHLAVTANVRCRRINDAERAVKNYLPKMLAENEPVRCSVGKTKSGRQLVFFLFDQQGILLRTVADQNITKIISDIQTAIDDRPNSIKLTEEEFDQISEQNVEAVLGFLERCNIDVESLQLMLPEIKAISGMHFDYKRSFGDAARVTTLKHICKEILAHGITLEELAQSLKELQQHDLR